VVGATLHIAATRPPTSTHLGVAASPNWLLITNTLRHDVTHQHRPELTLQNEGVRSTALRLIGGVKSANT
jgi:hypothetical protein